MQPDARSDRAKTVLFCPGCGHESPVHGDWLIEDDNGQRRYVCPECDTEIERRRRPPPRPC